MIIDKNLDEIFIFLILDQLCYQYDASFLITKFDGIRKQIDQDLLQPVFISIDQDTSVLNVYKIYGDF
jgi:hypothetical protein